MSLCCCVFHCYAGFSYAECHYTECCGPLLGVLMEDATVTYFANILKSLITLATDWHIRQATVARTTYTVLPPEQAPSYKEYTDTGP